MTVAAGKLTLEWWDADRGELREVVQIVHPGGPLRVQTPSFSGHLAFKLIRELAHAEPASLPTPVKK
jgi:trans-aconitate methyltransferase